MSLVINTNNIATITRNYLNTNQANLQRSLARLASGSRIVKPSDDAGGLAVGNKLSATLNRNSRAQQNVQNSISFLQVQDGALTQVGKILDRMSELKTMSLDVTKNSLDIANYDTEFNQLQDQLTNIRDEKFNGINLFTPNADPLTAYTTAVGAGVSKSTEFQVDTITGLAGALGDDDTFTVTLDGTAGTAVTMLGTDILTADAIAAQIALDFTGVTADSSAGDGTLTVTSDTAGTAFTLSIAAADGITATATTAAASSSTTTANVDTSVNVSLSRLNIFEEGTANAGLTTSSLQDLTDRTAASGDSDSLSDFSVDDFVTFIQNAATARANNGAEMSRLEASHALLTTNHANIESARSRLMDVDIAIESTHFAKHNILVQSSAAMLAQANAVPNVALQLLG